LIRVLVGLVADVATRACAVRHGFHAKTLNIELTRPNTSNLKDLPYADRKIAEAHIEKWKLIEPAE
jgi:hypothetical protein